jgi:site-specific recombinase XerD
MSSFTAREARAVVLVGGPRHHVLSPERQASRMLGVALTHPAAVYVGSCASPESRRTTMTSLRTAARFWGGQTVAQCAWEKLTATHLVVLRAHLAETRAPATANKILSAVRGVLKMATRLGLMTRDAYASAVDVPTVRGHRVSPGRSLTREEVAKLVENCEGRGPIGHRNRALLALLFGAGLRRSEVLSLNVGDGSYTAVLRVRGKGNKERLVFLAPPVRRAFACWMDLVLSHLGRGPEVPLFVSFTRPNARGVNSVATTARLTPNGLYRVFQAMCRQCGIAHATLHDLRRTFAGDMLQAGVDIATLQGMMGHASPTTTSTYDRRPDAVRQEAADRIVFPF